MEKWKAVVGYEGRYEVSNFGQVKNTRTGRIKKATINKKDGRPYLLLWKNNRKPKMLRVHTIVLTAFKGKRPRGKEGCHNDGNNQNNMLRNLRWDTPQRNHADKVRHGTTNRGERCGAARLTEREVSAIRKDTRLQRIIAADYAILQNHVSRIKSGKRWKHSFT